MRLRDVSCLLIWEVAGPGQAIEDAWNHPLGEALRHALVNIDWIPDTGGTIVRTNAATDAAGSATRRYGPLGLGPEGSKQ